MEIGSQNSGQFSLQSHPLWVTLYIISEIPAGFHGKNMSLDARPEGLMGYILLGHITIEI